MHDSSHEGASPCGTSVQVPLDARLASAEYRLEVLQSIIRAAGALESNDRLKPLLQAIMDQSRQIMDAEASSLLLYDEASKELVFEVAISNVSNALGSVRMPLGRGIAGHVAQTRASFLTNNAAECPLFFGGMDRQTGFVTRAILCVPLCHDDRLVGVCQVINRRGGRDFTRDDVGLLETFASLAAVMISNARMREDRVALLRMEQEVQVAHSIQTSLLPRKFPPSREFPHVSLHAVSQPAREVGGDFHDHFPLPDGRLAMTIADVSGKGIAAGLFMAVSRTYLRSVCLRQPDPARALAEVNRLLCLENDADMFVTVFLAYYDPNTGVVDYANAGHNPPVVIRRDGSHFYCTELGGIVLGVLPDARYRSDRLCLAPEDLLVLFTDGITEAPSPDMVEFGDERLLELLLPRRDQPLEPLCARVTRTVMEYQQGQQFDDITLLLCRRDWPSPAAHAQAVVGGVPPDWQCQVRNRLEELDGAVTASRAFLVGRQLSEPLCFDLNLVLEELVVNIITHGYRDDAEHLIDIALWMENGNLWLRVEDDGIAFNPLTVPQPDLNLPPEERPIGGLGVFLVRKLSRVLAYERDHGRNRTTLMLRPSPPEA